MLPKKCEKCRVNIAVKQCTQCFKEYCQLCGTFEKGICQICMQLISKDKTKGRFTRPVPKNVDDYFEY